jgi:DNA-directed RNA polymerase subunit K/omega
MMSYLELVEEYPKDYKSTLFEKVLMAAKRTKALHNGKMPLLPSIKKDTYLALEEAKHGKIALAYREEEPPQELAYVSEDGDDED